MWYALFEDHKGRLSGHLIPGGKSAAKALIQFNEMRAVGWSWTFCDSHRQVLPRILQLFVNQHQLMSGRWLRMDTLVPNEGFQAPEGATDDDSRDEGNENAKAPNPYGLEIKVIYSLLI